MKRTFFSPSPVWVSTRHITTWQEGYVKWGSLVAEKLQNLPPEWENMKPSAHFWIIKILICSWNIMFVPFVVFAPSTFSFLLSVLTSVHGNNNISWYFNNHKLSKSSFSALLSLKRSFDVGAYGAICTLCNNVYAAYPNCCLHLSVV